MSKTLELMLEKGIVREISTDSTQSFVGDFSFPEMGNVFKMSVQDDEFNGLMDQGLDIPYLTRDIKYPLYVSKLMGGPCMYHKNMLSPVILLIITYYVHIYGIVPSIMEEMEHIAIKCGIISVLSMSTFYLGRNRMLKMRKSA